MKRRVLVGVIAAITFSTLFVEVLLTRALSVVYFGHTAFLIISLALFGYGLSGVYLSARRIAGDEKSLSRLSGFLFLFAVSLPVVYKLVLLMRIDFLHLFDPFHNFLFLVGTFLLLVLPFFFGGVTLALIFSVYSREIGRLYFVDLAAAALGSLAVIPLLPLFGPSRLLLIVSLLLLLAWTLLARARRPVKWSALGLGLLTFLVLYRVEDTFFPIMPVETPGEEKRYYAIQKIQNKIDFSGWSTINKIDVAPWAFPPPQKVVWINGGTMQSYIKQWDGNLEGLQPIGTNDIAAIPYHMARNRNAAMVIGSAGGYEVLCALSLRFKKVVAVEMDPLICRLLRREYAGYSGRLFFQPKVELLADEGRSVVQRMRMKLDVIQMVNSHNTDELLSGALSVSETYIYTVEAFKDYWRRLNDDGLLYIVHWMGERLFTTGLQALAEMNVPEPHKHFLILQKWLRTPKGVLLPGFCHFIMKKGLFSDRELAIAADITTPDDSVYWPGRSGSHFYYEIARDPAAAVRASAVNLAPVYDDSPYFNQPNKIGQFRFANIRIDGVARDLVTPNMVFSNSIYLSILGLALLFSALFIWLPLRLGARGGGRSPLIGYFFLIGVAFISVEIIAIKIFQLFLGSPAISISVIIFSLLVSSGVGSLASSRLHGRRGLLPALAAVIAAVLVLYGLFLFKVLRLFLFLPAAGRMLVSLALLFVPGFIMGQFFPWGIRVLGEKQSGQVGWAWGANAFATVLGSILTVIVSINWGFAAALYVAAACYLGAGFIARRVSG